MIVSGKLRAQRAKSMKFKDGYMVSSGQPVKEYIDSAVRHVLLRQVSMCSVIFLPTVRQVKYWLSHGVCLNSVVLGGIQLDDYSLPSHHTQQQNAQSDPLLSPFTLKLRFYCYLRIPFGWME